MIRSLFFLLLSSPAFAGLYGGNVIEDLLGNAVGPLTTQSSVNYLPVVLSPTQTGINSFLDKSGSGTIAALNAALNMTPNGMSSASIGVLGTWVGTIQFQGQAGDGTWNPILGFLPGTGNVVDVLTANGSLLFPVGGFSQIRAIFIAYTSGTATVTWNLGAGVNGAQVFNLVPANLMATVIGSGTAGTPASGVVTVQGIASGTPFTNNITQIAGNAINTGTGAAGTGTVRVSVSNDSKVQVWDGTNTATVKAGSTQASLTDTATVITGRPDNVGTPTQTSVSCAATSTTLLAASTATMFISIRNPTTSTQTVWINLTGVAAVAAAPSIDLAPGSEYDAFAEGASFLSTAQVNCISGGTASTVTLVYK